MAITGINNSSYTSYYASGYKNTVKRQQIFKKENSRQNKDGRRDKNCKIVQLKVRIKCSNRPKNRCEDCS